MSGFTHETGYRNKTVEWYTPEYIFDALGVEFDLDVCSPGMDIVPWIPTKECFTENDDGLAKPWHGLVWMNPPYGKYTPLWLEKLANHGNGIALLFSRTDSKWFHKNVKNATAICFIEGRIRFINGIDGKAGKSPGAGSMLIGYGDIASNAIMQSNLGLSVKLAEVDHGKLQS